MEKQVIFRDRQELQSADLNNIETHASNSLQHLRADAVSSGLHYTGGLVAATSATEISVAALRFYNEGKVYVSEDALSLNLFQYLPLVTKKIVAVVCWGQQTDTLVEPRDFLTDLTTGATQPQAVAMQSLNACNVNLLPGAESADPQPPVIQTNTLAIAYVYLSPTGIERVEMQSGYRLPNLADHAQRVTGLEVWKALAEPRISSIATDLAALGNKTDGLARRDQLIEMAVDLARTKAKLNLPSAYASYQSDYFGDASLTDVTAGGYSAQVKNGLIFPVAGQASAPLALFNPYDSGVSRSADDLILPAYTEKERLKTEGYSGDISISQYQVQTQTLREYQTTVWDYNYGWHGNYYWGWYNNYYWNYNNRWYGWYGWNWGYYGYYTQHTETHYELQTVTTSYAGAIIAQTFLVSNSMWLTSVGLQFTQIGHSGDILLAVCETTDGKPDLEKTLARVTVARADLKKYPTETQIPIKPVLLEAGTRYALALITQGDHRVATVNGNRYTAGTLFFGTDGEYFTGDLTKDLMFTLRAAEFDRARVEVSLQSISLAGGMTDLALSAPQVVPAGCELWYEIQVGGKWYRLGEENTSYLASAPDIVPIRAVLMGTHDLAPAFQLAANALSGTRPATAFTHFSAERTLAAPSTNIQVQVVVAQFDATKHTLACALIDGATVITPAATVVKDEPDGKAKRITYTFAPATGISAYKVRLMGQRSDGANPFVIVERTDVAS